MLCLRGSRTTKHELNPGFSGVEIANVRNIKGTMLFLIIVYVFKRKFVYLVWERFLSMNLLLLRFNSFYLYLCFVIYIPINIVLSYVRVKMNEVKKLWFKTRWLNLHSIKLCLLDWFWSFQNLKDKHIEDVLYLKFTACLSSCSLTFYFVNCSLVCSCCDNTLFLFRSPERNQSKEKTPHGR